MPVYNSKDYLSTDSVIDEAEEIDFSQTGFPQRLEEFDHLRKKYSNNQEDCQKRMEDFIKCSNDTKSSYFKSDRDPMKTSFSTAFSESKTECSTNYKRKRKYSEKDPFLDYNNGYSQKYEKYRKGSMSQAELN